MRVLVVTGPSGGHIFPALGFLETLLRESPQIEALLVLPRSYVASQIGSLDYKINYISISSLRLSVDFQNLISILRLFKGVLQSLFILLAFRPQIVVGFGSFTCIPLIVFSWAFRIKTLLHEQNVVPGRANRFLAGFADRITVSFQETKAYFKAYQDKAVFTGNPIRKELIRISKDEALKFFGFQINKFTILVMGGSQGSHSINLGFLRAVSMVQYRHNLQIIHISGIKDYDFLRQRYRDLNINIKLFSFLRSMQYAYSASDLVVSRAGATSIAEIIFFRAPAILIPYPYAHDHQLNNAKVLNSLNSAIIIEDIKLNTDILKKTIENLINNPEGLSRMCSYYDPISKTDANDLLVKEVLSLN